jgi:ribosomal protein L7/L12
MMATRHGLIELARSLRAKGLPTDQVLRSLREAGAEQIDCVVVLREVDQISLGRAKELVDSSQVWADRHATNARLREASVKVLVEETTRD